MTRSAIGSDWNNGCKQENRNDGHRELHDRVLGLKWALRAMEVLQRKMKDGMSRDRHGVDEKGFV